MSQASETDIEQRWAMLRSSLADGLDDGQTRADFWCLLEERLRTMLLEGPANDVAGSRVRGRFAGILRDPHAAEDFLSDLLVDLVRRFDEGFYHREEFRHLDAIEGLGRWLRQCVSGRMPCWRGAMRASGPFDEECLLQGPLRSSSSQVLRSRMHCAA